MKKLKTRIIALIIGSQSLFVPIFANAAGSTFDPGDISSLRAEKPKVSGVKVDGKLSIEAIQYPTKLPDNSEAQTTFMSADLKIQHGTTNSESKIDANFGKYTTAHGDQFFAREMYTSVVSASKETQFAVGRKIETWSQLDKDWDLGMWQPRHRVDPLRPETEGLTGFFFNQKFGVLEVGAYFSPIFIPTTGPEVQEKDGSLVSDGRWYRSPSSSFALFGKSTRIAYNLDIPEIAKLVNNPGAGIRVGLNASGRGAFISGNYAYKPMNDLILQYKKNLFLPEVDPQTGEVTISPAVAYHQVFGGDIGWHFEKGTLSASVLQDLPDAKAAQDSYVIQNPDPMNAVSVHADMLMNTFMTRLPMKLSLDYMHISGGGIHDYDSNGVAQGAIFENRFDFVNVASIRGEFSTVLGSKKLLSGLKYTREFDQKGGIFNAQFDYFPANSVALVMGLDFLGVDDTSKDNKDTRFLNQYRANDRYYGGMRYVF